MLPMLVLVSYLLFTRLTAVGRRLDAILCSVPLPPTDRPECNEWMLPSRLILYPMLTLSPSTDSFSGKGILMKLWPVSLA